MPKTIKPTVTLQRTTRNSMDLVESSCISKEKESDIVFEKNEDVPLYLPMKVSLENLKLENEDRFKHNEAHFRFYTGLPSYAIFEVFLYFLKPAAENLLYWGNISCDKQTDTCTEKKVGRNRKLTCEEELFLVLVRIRNNFPLEDMAIRFGMNVHK